MCAAKLEPTRPVAAARALALPTPQIRASFGAVSERPNPTDARPRASLPPRGSQAAFAAREFARVSQTGAPPLASRMASRARRRNRTVPEISWGPACVRLHVKIIQQPNIAINQMIANMTQVYASVGIDVRLGTTENLNLPATFLDIDVGGCTMGSTTTEQNQLFSNRNNVRPDYVVAYFV